MLKTHIKNPTISNRRKNIYFDPIDIFEKRELSYVFLLNGPKGIGKATFAYHLINYLFSKDDSEKYSLEHYTINKDNVNFNLISKNIAYEQKINKNLDFMFVFL